MTKLKSISCGSGKYPPADDSWQWGVGAGGGEDKGAGRVSVCGLLGALLGAPRRFVQYCSESGLVNGFAGIVEKHIIITHHSARTPGSGWQKASCRLGSGYQILASRQPRMSCEFSQNRLHVQGRMPCMRKRLVGNRYTCRTAWMRNLAARTYLAGGLFPA
jgi:hypothetical protein